MRGEQDAEPRSVVELARDPGWQIVTGAGGQWITAEAVVQAGGRQWRIGLTPVRPGVTALMLWEDSVVVDHVRGSEEAMSARAARWRRNLADGLPWQDAAARR